MNNEEMNFEEFLKSKLENHTVEVSDSVWASIEKKQKKREIFFWFKPYLNVFIALDIAILLGFTAFTLLNTNEVHSKNKMNASNQMPSKSRLTEGVSTAETSLNAEPMTSNNNQLIERKYENKNEDLVRNKKLVSQNSSTKNKLTEEKTNQNKIKISEKTNNNKNALESTLTELLPDEVIEINSASSNYNFSSLPLIKLSSVSKEINNSYPLNDTKQAFSDLPNSIELSKSKKVLKAEQKAADKINKASAKEAQMLQKAAANQEKIEKEKAVSKDKTADAAAAETSENDIAPFALDTVYGKKKFKGYLAIDALISPEIAGSSLKGNNQKVENYISRRDSAENLRLAYSATMRVNLFLNKNIFINTGISFAQRKEKFNIIHKWQSHEAYIDSSEFVTYVDPFAGNIIYKTYDTLDLVVTHKDTVRHNLTMSFLDIPLMIGYKWLGKKSGFAIQGGVIFNVLFKQKGIISDFTYAANDVKTIPQQPFNTSAGLSLAGGFTSNHKLRNNLDLIIEPHTRYTLKPIQKSDYPLQQKLFSYGLNVGLRLKL